MHTSLRTVRFCVYRHSGYASGVPLVTGATGKAVRGGGSLAGDWWVYRSVIVKWVAGVGVIAMVSSFGSIWLAESSVLSG